MKSFSVNYGILGMEKNLMNKFARPLEVSSPPKQSDFIKNELTDKPPGRLKNITENNGEYVIN